MLPAAEIISPYISKAKIGDLAAMRFLYEFVCGEPFEDPRPGWRNWINVGVGQRLAAMGPQLIVDAPAIAPVESGRKPDGHLLWFATAARPGSEEKQTLLALRLFLHMPLHHPEDSHDDVSGRDAFLELAGKNS